MDKKELEYVEQWILSRPKAVQKMMLRFPPDCVVRAKQNVTLLCPRPGIAARLVSYTEYPDKVGVRVLCGNIAAECDPDWLVLVEEGSYPRSAVKALLKKHAKRGRHEKETPN